MFGDFRIFNHSSMLPDNKNIYFQDCKLKDYLKVYIFKTSNLQNFKTLCYNLLTGKNDKLDHYLNLFQGVTLNQ